MIGNVSTAQGKIGLITAMSAIYSEHFALVADHLNDIGKAFSVLEHARGRVPTDLLMSGNPPSSAEELEIEKQISRLNVDLAKAKSAEQVRQVRDNIFLAEQARWLAPASGPWKSRPWETIPLERIREGLATNELILEYVLAQPHSFCLAISRDFARVVPVAGRESVEELVAAYLKTLKTKGASKPEGSQLYSALLKEIPEVAKKERLVIVPDGRLHLLPFDALVDGGGRYLVYSHTITYAPSATAMYLVNSMAPHQPVQQTLLAVGGIPYDQTADLNKLAKMRGSTTNALVSLPASKDEVLAAEAAVHGGTNTLLIGPTATKSAFDRSNLDQRAIIHLAVHGVADAKHPDRAALILLSDSQVGDDGILEASEIVHLHLNADLVVLSACDTAVGSLQGEEGIASLSLAFMLAGAEHVVSTIWSIDDTSTLYLMMRVY